MDDVGFRFLAADQAPDFRSIARFCRRHLDSLADLFLQSLLLAQKLGMVKMGRVAQDGTKLEANAPKHKAMSYGRLVDKEERTEAEIAELEAKAAALLADAEATDAAEDQAFGVEGKETDLPAELDGREKRLARLQAARAQIEAEAAEKARRHAEGKERRRQDRVGTSDVQAVTDAGEQAAVKARPEPKAQANFTDSEATTPSRPSSTSPTAPKRTSKPRRYANSPAAPTLSWSPAASSTTNRSRPHPADASPRTRP